MEQYAFRSTPKKINSTDRKTGKRSKKSSPATKGQKSLTMFFKKKKADKLKHLKFDDYLYLVIRIIYVAMLRKNLPPTFPLFRQIPCYLLNLVLILPHLFIRSTKTSPGSTSNWLEGSCSIIWSAFPTVLNSRT